MPQQPWITKEMQALFRGVLKVKTTEECGRFLRDLMTIEEIREMSNRWKAAQLLNEGLPYRDIAATTGMSTTTVARIAHWLNDGEGGYRLVLDRMKKNSQNNTHHSHRKRSLMNRGEQRM